MTTKFLDNKICTFKILLSWRFPQNTGFLDDFPLWPQGPPPRKRKSYFYCRLAVSEIKQMYFSAFFRAPPGYPSQSPGASLQRVCFPGFRGTYRTFWPPTPSRGRPPPHRKLSGPKSLSLCSFLLPEDLHSSTVCHLKFVPLSAPCVLILLENSNNIFEDLYWVHA